MERHAISDADWDRVRALLPRRGPQGGTRLFVDAALHMAADGGPWRDLPARFGKWNTAFRRFRRWAESGVWGRVLAALADPDVSTLVLDSTVVRAHPAAAGAAQKRGRRRSGTAGAGSGRRPTSRSPAAATRSR